MKHRSRIAASLTLLALAGCAAPPKEDIESPNGIYMTVPQPTPSGDRVLALQRAAYFSAAKFCATKGGMAVVVDAQDRVTYGAALVDAGNGTVSLRFHCRPG